ncbi:hypothetical protein [Lysobacter gummosus]|uniref:hypothetical protein n=1 Tax=Lysobacter gummosus TaxID=262324 RepID=UPI0036289D80
MTRLFAGAAQAVLNRNDVYKRSDASTRRLSAPNRALDTGRSIQKLVADCRFG